MRKTSLLIQGNGARNSGMYKINKKINITENIRVIIRNKIEMLWILSQNKCLSFRSVMKLTKKAKGEHKVPLGDNLNSLKVFSKVL